MTMCKCVPFGDSAMAVVLGKEISEAVCRRIQALKKAVESANAPGIIETVPTYCSLLVYYDPTALSRADAQKLLMRLQAGARASALARPTVIEIPVCYGGEFGPDIEYVARTHGLSVSEVIKRHSQRDYLIHMLGFIAGFPYLGEMDKSLATPRMTKPRIRIKAGSVGIGGEQTGIYPVASPGGWRLIGNTPVKLYDPLRNKAALLDAGSFIRFRPVSKEEYAAIAREVSDGAYKCVTWERGAQHGLFS